MMARAKRIYTLIIKVNNLFSFFSWRCFLKEIEDMFFVFLSRYRNTRESFGELEKAVETLACGSCSHSISRSPKLPLVLLYNSIETRNMVSISYRWFPVRTVQSQQPNVYKNYKSSLDGMWIYVIHYKPHNKSLRLSKFFFQQLHWFLQLQSCFIKWYEKEWNIKLCVHNGGWHETLNLLHVSNCKMFTFYDIIHETKQKM